MKHFIPVFILGLFSSLLVNSQTLADLDTNKYTIRLPSFWKPGNKIWQILTEKLPQVCEEIQDKDLCGDNCNPKYSIELEIYEPLVLDHDFYCTNSASTGPIRDWVFLTYYNFHSSFLLLNEKREIITRFVLVDSTETFMVRKQESFRLQPEVIYRPSRFVMNPGSSTFTLVRSQGQVANPVAQVRYRDNINPYDYVEKNKQGLFPSDLELFAIIDKKIRSWKQ